MKKFIVVTMILILLIAGAAAAFDTPTQTDYQDRGWLNNIAIQFGLLNATGNTGSWDFDNIYDSFFCEFTRQGTASIVLHLQVSKLDADHAASGFVNVTTAAGHTVDLDTDNLQFSVNRGSHYGRTMRIKVESGATATHALSNAVCGVVGR